jgi:hypothetical protein
MTQTDRAFEQANAKLLLQLAFSPFLANREPQIKAPFSSPFALP